MGLPPLKRLHAATQPPSAVGERLGRLGAQGLQSFAELLLAAPGSAMGAPWERLEAFRRAVGAPQRAGERWESARERL